MGLLEQHGGCHSQTIGQGRAVDTAAGHFVALAVPGLLRLGVIVDIGQSQFHKLLRARGQTIDQSQGQRFAGVEQFALHQIGLRCHQTQQTCHLGDARCPRYQAQRDLWQTESDFGLVKRKTCMGYQRNLPTTTQCSTLQQRHHGLAHGLNTAKRLLHSLNPHKTSFGVTGLQFQHAFKVGACKKRGLGRGQQHTFQRSLVCSQLIRQSQHVCLPLGLHGVHRRTRLVEGDGGNALRAQFVTQSRKSHVRSVQ